MTGLTEDTKPPGSDSPASLSGQSATTTNTTRTEQLGNSGRRRKRFDYEDTYEWEDDDDLTYEVTRYESIIWTFARTL